MNKAVPWRIKGVGFDARAAAIEAARRSGMSLGEWLNTVIAEQAEVDGVDERQLDADERLDAVTQRLSRLRDGRDVQNEVRSNKVREREPEEPRDRADRRPRVTSRETFRAEIDAEALLENAIAAFDRRANRSSERTARALAQVADLIDSGNRERERDDTALASIADRLAHIEQRVSRETVPKTDPSVQQALARLEERLDDLGRQPQESAPRDVIVKPDPAIQTALERMEKRLEGLSRTPVAPDRAEANDTPVPPPAKMPSAKRPLALAIAEVARRQRELDGPNDRGPAVVSRMPALGRLSEAAPNPLELRLAALVDRLERSAIRPADRETAPDLNGLQGNITSLADRIETMRGEIAARTPAPATGDKDEIALVRRELSAMSRAVADLAPRASVAALEQAVRDLSARITESRIEGAGDSALAPVETLVRELLAVVRNADPRAAIDSLDRSIRSVAAKLETFDGATVADPDLARGIAEQTREMRDTLARISENLLPGERLERGLADLTTRVEQLATAGTDPLGRGEMAQRVSEIRAMLADPIAPEQTLQLLEQRFDAIASRVDAVFGEKLDTMQRTFAAELEARAKTPVADTLVNDLGSRIDEALSSGLKAMERTVAQLVGNGTPRVDPASSRLEAMVGDLAARIDASAAPNAGSDALDAVQRQIERLTAHFDQNDQTGEMLVRLQTSVAELFTRLDRSQALAIDAAEAAARHAAADALRDVGSPAADASRELADLRSLQNEADHRTHATLTAVHDTLSQVVNRLSALEDDIADVRHAAPAIPEPSRAASLSAATERLRQTERTHQAASDERRAPPLARDDDDVLIEPGSALGRKRGAGEEGPEYRPQASFIQAARRAAQAAGAAPDIAPDAAARRPDPTKKVAALDQVRAYYASRKRPILLSLAALMVIFGAWQVAKVAMEDRNPPSAAQSSKSSAVTTPREKVAEKPAAIVATTASTEALPGDPSAAIPSNTASARKAEASVATPTDGQSTQTPVVTPPLDRSPVGTVAHTEPTADTNAIVRALAIAGDSAAQYELAVRYADGKVLARDLKLSQQWFEKAASKGVVPAQYRLGALYERGLGVAKDPAQAKSWYLRAAEAGNARAMHNLAVLYADGTSGKPDYSEAIVWFRRAAEFGIRDSQFNLAILYARGLGTPVNMVEAYLWFAAAAAQGDEDAGKKREDVAARLPANDLARAKAFVTAFKSKPLDAASNEVTPPPGGWESMKVPPRPEKTTTRPKVSAL